MLGLRFKTTCPHCKQEHIVSLGNAKYYKVNNSECSYTKIKCCLCGKEYWLSHMTSMVRDVKKVDKSDKLDWSHTTCW